MTRGEFIFGSGAFAALGGCVGFSRGDEPVLRVGIVTDTHVGKTDASCARVRLAYRLFRDLGVDLVHNNGDVADAHYPTGYAAYRRMMDEVFADVPAANLGRRSDCRVTVTLEGFFGTVGRPIVACFSTEG